MTNNCLNQDSCEMDFSLYIDYSLAPAECVSFPARVYIQFRCDLPNENLVLN